MDILDILNELEQTAAPCCISPDRVYRLVQRLDNGTRVLESVCACGARTERTHKESEQVEEIDRDGPKCSYCGRGCEGTCRDSRALIGSPAGESYQEISPGLIVRTNPDTC